MIAEPEPSLLAGRNQEPLSERQIRMVAQTFLGLEETAAFVYDPERRTHFAVDDEDGEDIGRIRFGPDIFPGRSVIDPNSALSMKAAAAHELSHYHRWLDRTELPSGTLNHLDEALTSLDAALRYASDLTPHEIQQLVRDAIQRLQILQADLLSEQSV